MQYGNRPSASAAIPAARRPTPSCAASPKATTFMPGTASAIITADTGSTSMAIEPTAQRSERAYPSNCPVPVALAGSAPAAPVGRAAGAATGRG